MIFKTMKQTMKQRVAELSATLKPIAEPVSDNQFWEIQGVAEECTSYMFSYALYYDYRQDYDDTGYSCVIDKVEEFQVLRFFSFNAFMSDDYIRDYYTRTEEHEDEDDWIDEEEPEFPDLDITDITECKQIWIDRFGNTETIVFDQFDAENIFVSIKEKQDWFSNPQVSLAIIKAIKSEYEDYCHSEEELVLPTLKANYLHLIDKWQPNFATSAIEHGFTEDCFEYLNTLKVAIKHNYTLPTEYEDMKMYFDYLSSLVKMGRCLTEPRFVCPNNIREAYNAISEEYRNNLAEKKRLEALRNENDFAENHSYLFNIHFDNGHFQFDSLDSVEAYRMEGETMHHCIYQCAYYNKHDVLSMHVSDLEGNRVATCSVNVVKGTIVELQTICNDAQWRQGNEYKEIWNTLMARMHTFPRRQKEEVKQLKTA